MYDRIDEQQTKEYANRIQTTSLIDPLESCGLISDDARKSISSKVDELFEHVEAKEIPIGDVSDETYWEHLQELWGFADDGGPPVTKRVTPMNAANLCPIPTLLIESIGELRAEYNLNVSQQKRMVDPETGKEGLRLSQIRQARREIAQGLCLADSDDLAIVRNASEGNNLINCGYRGWRRTTDSNERENVVIWSENHPTNKVAWKLRAEWDSKSNPLFDIREVEFEVNDSDEEIARKFLSEIDANTRFVTFTETSNGNGFRIPETVVKQIWDHVHEKGYDCHIHIDATMTWGARPMNLRNPYCHSLVSSAHKWFLGPKETGILYMSRDKVKNFMPSIFAYDEAIHIWDPWDEMPETTQRFALLGQRDDVNIIHLEVAQGVWDRLTRRKPYDRIAYLAQTLKKKLQESGWKLVTPEDMNRSWGVVRVETPYEHPELNLYNWLYVNRQIAGSGGDSDFRLCPHIYNTMADIDRAIEGMNAWRDEC